MNDKFSYITLIILSIIGITLLPNLILKTMWSFEYGTPMETIVFNGMILPITLLIIVAYFNEKFDMDWWVLNYTLMIGAVLISIYLGFLNWAESAEKIPGGWGRNNIDSGTWMIIKMELKFGIGIIGIALLFKILTKLGKLKRKTYS